MAGHDHEVADLTAPLKEAGGTVETFLKDCVFPGSTRNFYELNEDLAGLGIALTDRSALHALRRAYNAAKHDPCYAPSARDVIKVFDDAIATFVSWRGIGISSCDLPAPPVYRRTIWIVGWDHYAHGDIEVHIFAPVEDGNLDFPLGIDTIYLKGLVFPNILSRLGTAVRAGKGLIPQRFIDLWEGEGDCAGSFVFDGAYRDLLRELARSELRLDLADHLKRENNPLAMRTAAAFAAVDAARTTGAPAGADALREAVLACAAMDYAAPLTSSLLRRYAHDFSTLIAKLPLADRQQITGPRFVPGGKFRRLQATAAFVGESALVRPGPELVLELGNR